MANNTIFYNDGCVSVNEVKLYQTNIAICKILYKLTRQSTLKRSQGLHRIPPRINNPKACPYHQLLQRFFFFRLHHLILAQTD